MTTRDERRDGVGNLGLWVLVSVALHVVLVFVVPYSRPTRSFKIYPLANAGLIELGPSGGKVGGGPDTKGGTGGGGRAHVLNNLPDKEQTIEPRTVPAPPRVGRLKGHPDSQAAVTQPENTRVPAVPTPSDTGTKVTEDPTPKVSQQPVGKVTDPDIMTSSSGKGTVAATAAPSSGNAVPAVPEGRPDGSVTGSGASNNQGALAGPGGPGKGAGGPGGDGDLPFAGSGEGYVVRGAPPVYPKYAENNGLEGKVGLRVVINAQGEPDQIQVVSTSREPVLDKACVQTIKKDWRFRPMGQGYVLTFVISFKSGDVIPDYTMGSVKPLG